MNVLILGGVAQEPRWQQTEKRQFAASYHFNKE